MQHSIEAFWVFHVVQQSAGHLIRYPEPQTHSIQRISRHIDLQPNRDAILTYTAVLIELEKLIKVR